MNSKIEVTKNALNAARDLRRDAEMLTKGAEWLEAFAARIRETEKWADEDAEILQAALNGRVRYFRSQIGAVR